MFTLYTWGCLSQNILKIVSVSAASIKVITDKIIKEYKVVNYSNEKKIQNL